MAVSNMVFKCIISAYINLFEIFKNKKRIRYTIKEVGLKSRSWVVQGGVT